MRSTEMTHWKDLKWSTRNPVEFKTARFVVQSVPWFCAMLTALARPKMLTWRPLCTWARF